MVRSFKVNIYVFSQTLFFCVYYLIGILKIYDHVHKHAFQRSLYIKITYFFTYPLLI